MGVRKSLISRVVAMLAAEMTVLLLSRYKPPRLYRAMTDLV
jgi:hypothetical protein